jgi:hypothetical protein
MDLVDGSSIVIRCRDNLKTPGSNQIGEMNITADRAAADYANTNRHPQLPMFT